MITYNIGFRDSSKRESETQLDVSDTVDLINLILSLQDEMDIKEILYIEEA